MKLRSPFAWAACAVLLIGAVVLATSVGFKSGLIGKAPVTSRWEDLVPKEWDPAKHLRDLKLDALNDSDPRVQQATREMRAAWDNAPINAHLDGERVRLMGFVVPLEAVQGAVREFLLVPYMGACIHKPPPPANQIVHVKLGQALPGLRQMDPVWISGTLRTQRQNSPMGMSGYSIDEAALQRYDPALPP